MKLPESLQNRLVSLCSNLRITKETHVDEIYMLKLEAKAIIREIEVYLKYKTPDKLETKRPLSHEDE